MAGEILGHVVAAKVTSGELGARLGLSNDELAVVERVLVGGAHGWRAFECETLDKDGTYVGTVRLTTHPAVTRGAGRGGIVAREPGAEDAVPDAALRRARPKLTPAQIRVRHALDPAAKSDPESREGDCERLESSAPAPETSTVTSV